SLAAAGLRVVPQMAVGRMARPPARIESGERRMRLLVVTPWPLASPGGAQRLAAGIARALASDHGFDVIVAAGSGAPGSAAVAPTIWPREIRLTLVRESYVLHRLEAVARDVEPDCILFASHYSASARQSADIAARLRVPFVLLPAIHLDRRNHTNGDARRF